MQSHRRQPTRLPCPWDSPGKNTRVGCHFTLLLLLSRFSRVRLCATPWTAAFQAPSSMGFPRQEYWSGVPLDLQSHGLTFLFFFLFQVSLSDIAWKGQTHSLWERGLTWAQEDWSRVLETDRRVWKGPDWRKEGNMGSLRGKRGGCIFKGDRYMEGDVPWQVFWH